MATTAATCALVIATLGGNPEDVALTAAAEAAAAAAPCALACHLSKFISTVVPEPELDVVITLAKGSDLP